MTAFAVESGRPPYRDPERAVDERVEDLLGRMTLDEKLAQLGSRWVFELADAAGATLPEADELLKDGLGQVTRISGASGMHPAAAAECANALQRHLVERTRLGIPAIVHEEICSGLMARGATVFPQAIGLAATFDPSLAEALASSVRDQMRSAGAHQGLGPVLDVCLDPRWGRLEETFGEDPHVVAQMGTAFVRGLQGDDLRAGVVATPKHFVGYGASVAGMNWGPAQIPPRELRDVYLHPFEAAVRGAGARSIMNAYVELDGIPCAADRDLLTEVLREQWGFEGCVVSDYFAIRQLATYHRFATDGRDAAVKTLEAGLDVELPSIDCYGQPLREAVETGLVSHDTLDTAVRRVLRTKFELGLFERPYVDVEAATAASGTPAHRALAREIARKSLVLLRNDGTLPLRDDLGSVAVIGPCADELRNLFGDYAYPAHIESLVHVLESGADPLWEPPAGLQVDGGSVVGTSVLAALLARLGERVQFARGCDVEGSSREGFPDAVAAARAADVAVLVLGDKSGLTPESTTGESRDRSSLDLPGVQAELLAAVADTGTPVILVLVAGRPYGPVWAHERCAAVLMAWLPGEEGADAIADVLLGAVSPGGKLPVSYPRSSGHIPLTYRNKPSGGRSHWRTDYADAPSAPLYPFGHGLGYTTFVLADPAVRQSDAGIDGAVTVQVTVCNTGRRDGEEVVQLYAGGRQASVTRPVLELKSFARVDVPAGRSRRVTFDVPVAQLGFHGRDLEYVVEPGVIDFHVGTSATELVHAGSATIEGDRPLVPKKAFAGWVTVE